MQLDCLEHIRPFEDEETPLGGGRWLAGFGWFVVFEGNFGAGYGVGLASEKASRGEIRFLPVWLFFFCDRTRGIVSAEGDFLRQERFTAPRKR